MWEQTDNSSKVMSLKEIMEREKVDHMLAAGQVSDYQLAMADEKAKQVLLSSQNLVARVFRACAHA